MLWWKHWQNSVQDTVNQRENDEHCLGGFPRGIDLCIEFYRMRNGTQGDQRWKQIPSKRAKIGDINHDGMFRFCHNGG